MAHPQNAPCVNSNDEVVQVVSVNVAAGAFVKQGDVIGSVETDKSLVDVVAERSGYVLRVECRPDQKVRVGSVMLWLGDAVDEPVPAATPTGTPRTATDARPTAKARAMLNELGLDAAQIPISGERLTVADIEAWLGRNGSTRPLGLPAPVAARSAEPRPQVAGELQPLTVEGTGMLNTVLWHRDHAAAAYLELAIDPKPWDAYAAQYATRNKLMLSPLLPLMAFRLALLARERPQINATLLEGQRYQYGPVNLGFTVQAGPTLYLAVVRDTQAMDAARFIDALGEVQRHALARKLRPDESTGATLSFTSMARWNVTRHIPILPPCTSLIVAHASPKDAATAVLGATYDHRLLSGFDVVQVLQALAQPPA